MAPWLLTITMTADNHHDSDKKKPWKDKRKGSTQVLGHFPPITRKDMNIPLLTFKANPFIREILYFNPLTHHLLRSWSMSHVPISSFHGHQMKPELLDTHFQFRVLASWHWTEKDPIFWETSFVANTMYSFLTIELLTKRLGHTSVALGGKRVYVWQLSWGLNSQKASHGPT